MKVLSVIGTRPEAIKMAPVILELGRHPEKFQSVVCLTAQHREMLDQALALFQITPDYDLNIMTVNQSPLDVAAAVLIRLAPILRKERPDWVLVQGDTTTVMAAGIAAFYERCRVGHVEAGLRTGDKYQPFPEEINRRVASVVADLHFAPTETAAGNLRGEGIQCENIVVTGNTVIDAVRFVASMPFDPTGTDLSKIPASLKRIILVTAHRRENFGKGIDEICAGLKALACRNSDIHIVYPVHPNPNVRVPVYASLSNVPNITLLPPIEYLPLVWLLKRCYFVLTDSGGIQEEAPGLGKPVLVMRSKTERPEGVDAGAVKLVGANRESISRSGQELLDDSATYARMAHSTNPYGDGKASQRIVATILSSSAGYNTELPLLSPRLNT